MPSNKVKYFIEKLLPEEKSGGINISVNKKEQKVYITLPEDLVGPMLVQYMSKLKSLPDMYIPVGKVIKTPFFGYTTEGNYIRGQAEKLGAPSIEAYTFQKVLENLKNGCALVLTSAQMNQLCKMMGLQYGYEDFVFVMDALGENVNPNSTSIHFKLEDKDELTPGQFVKAFRAKANREYFSFLKADADTRLKSELPEIDMEKIKEKVEKNPNSEIAQVYRKLSGGI
jgi:hypothetical protein